MYYREDYLKMLRNELQYKVNQLLDAVTPRGEGFNVCGNTVGFITGGDVQSAVSGIKTILVEIKRLK